MKTYGLSIIIVKLYRWKFWYKCCLKYSLE